MSNVTTNEKIVEEPKMCSKKEQIAHAIGVLGHDSAYSLWSSWMTPFLTDIMQLPSIVLGILLAIGRIFDGVNDVMMGAYVDRTRSKLGRFRPWILRAGPLFCLIMACSFILPGNNMTVRIIYACVMYLAVDLVFTAVDIPFWSLPAAMTSNTKERSGIIGTTQTTSTAISGIIGIVIPLLLVQFGGGTEWTAYFKSAALVAVFAAIMYLYCGKTVREHVVPEDSEKFSLKLGIKSIVTNKPLLIVQICNAVALLTLIMRANFNYYYCVYNLGGMNVVALMSGVKTIGSVLGSTLFIFLAKKFGKKPLMFVFAGGFTVISMIHYFAGWSNLALVATCYATSSIFSGAYLVCVMTMIADTIEYGEWKTGQRNEGMITSTRCFVTKCVMAVSGVAVAAVTGLFGYTPGAAQSLELQNAFHNMMTIVCAGIMLLSTIPLFFYDLTEKRHAEILEELKARKAGK